MAFRRYDNPDQVRSVKMELEDAINEYILSKKPFKALEEAIRYYNLEGQNPKLQYLTAVDETLDNYLDREENTNYDRIRNANATPFEKSEAERMLRLKNQYHSIKRVVDRMENAKVRETLKRW